MIFDIVETKNVLAFVERYSTSLDAAYIVASTYSINFAIKHRGPFLRCYNGYENALCWVKVVKEDEHEQDNGTCR